MPIAVGKGACHFVFSANTKADFVSRHFTGRMNMHVLGSSLAVGSALPKTVGKRVKAIRGVRVNDVVFRCPLVAITPPGTLSDIVEISTVLNVSFVGLFSRLHVCPGRGGVIFPMSSAPLPTSKHGVVLASHTLGVGTRTGGKRELGLRFSAKYSATNLCCQCCRNRGSRLSTSNGQRRVANNNFGVIMAGRVLHLPSFHVGINGIPIRLGGLTISAAGNSFRASSSTKVVNVSVVGRFSYIAVGLGRVFLGLRWCPYVSCAIL